MSKQSRARSHHSLRICDSRERLGCRYHCYRELAHRQDSRWCLCIIYYPLRLRHSYRPHRIGDVQPLSPDHRNTLCRNSHVPVAIIRYVFLTVGRECAKQLALQRYTRPQRVKSAMPNNAGKCHPQIPESEIRYGLSTEDAHSLATIASILSSRRINLDC
ncbi:hypothetical protein AVEN_124561-1 [Araneus ventricosus]|uniref:Uncharacterized protein n=1 Tax=Araneus ventricosus TaxID=182803 RepID=A0A4Y2HTC0_ARAVE|nr:hypothetical protein AVEN_124561-1 [Araneus ventricosus]